ncbi:hypothetical protein ACFWRZ_23800, partial [Streptomyces rubiginosohelvolus]|uniref:hypothetical protein n=1 Tax=Streptomyces rubiginosohelvolus TaxID=67362 RepID=UPI003659CCA4
ALVATLNGTLDAALVATLDSTLDRAFDAALVGTLDRALDAALVATLDSTLNGALDAALVSALDRALDAALVATLDVARVGAADRVVAVERARLDLDVRDAGVDADLQRLRRTGRSQRGTRGNDRTSGYPRDAHTRLLRHLLLPPVADLVSGAAICGQRALGVSLRQGHVVSWSPRPAPRYTPAPDIRMLL